MEWIQQNPDFFIFFIVVAGAVILLIMNARKSSRMGIGDAWATAQRYLANLASENEKTLCSSCGIADQDGYFYKIRNLNYCPKCFSRMFKNTKLGLGFFIGMMILGLLLAAIGITQDYSRGVLTKDNFIHFVKMFLCFMILPCGLLIWWIYREFNMLRSAKESKRNG